MQTQYQNINDFLKAQQVHTNLLLQQEILKHKEQISKFNDFKGTEDEALQELKSQILIQRDFLFKEIKNTNLEKLKNFYQLNDSQLEILIFCLSIQLNPDYVRTIRVLTENSMNSYPTIDLLNSVVYHSCKESYENKLFVINKLITNCLLEVASAKNNEPVIGNEQIRVPNRIVNFILGNNSIANEITSFVEISKNSSVIITNDKYDILTHLVQKKKAEIEINKTNMVVHLEGNQGSEKETSAKEICKKLTIPLLIIDVEQALESSLSLSKIMQLLYRESILTNCALYFKGIECLYDEDATASLLEFKSEIKKNPYLIFLSSREPLVISKDFATKKFFHFKFTLPNYKKRKELWNHFIGNQYQLSSEVDINIIANKYQLNAGQIKNALKDAYNLSLLKEGKNINIEDLTTACKAQSHHKLNELAQKIIHFQSWDELILPENEIKQLHEIINYFNHKHIVYEQWGYGKKSPLGKGLNILFFGQSGTGKTMAAGVIAKELQLDLYKIDLSTIVSKYIGETEKNLNKIFTEAQTSNAILFFDEADALFGARSDVKDAHDRYANIEVGYLLQKMEEYTGIAILATNMKDNMDDAFIRRMHSIVEFYYPDEKHRYKIWKKAFTSKTPMKNDVDLAFMAKQFHLSGGNIRNIALFAGFYAASNGGQVTMEHLIYSTKREFEKMGRSATRQEFGEYYELVKE